MNRKLIQFLLILNVLAIQSCSKINYLEKCWEKQVKPIQEELTEISFKEKRNQLGHNSQPWEKSKYSVIGRIWIGGNKFLKLDTIITSRGNKYFSKTNYSNDILLYQDYGENKLASVTKDMVFEELIKSARYSPINLIEYFINNQSLVSEETNQEYTIYSLNTEDKEIDIWIDNKKFLVTKITHLYNHDLYGDVKTTYSYSNYKNLHDSLWYANKIGIKKINGKIVDEVILDTLKISDDRELKLINKPEGYKIQESTEINKPKIKVNQYNEFIHLIELEHTDDRVMVVEFDEFLLVAEAPLNSDNGELIIIEARKIAPSKPIRYFVFGHHHQHYLGGLRAFVHKEATIICTEINKEYVEFIANAQHAIKSDSLHLYPKPLKTEIVKDNISIGEKNKMIIYFIGEKSKHTKDYLIYYFPDQNLLFQDDLCWIPKEGEIGKARDRQAGLYHAIKELNLEVDTIIQSWPVKDYGVKTIIPFKDLETSMGRKK